MKKIKLFFILASLLIGEGSLWAQTDVTSEYLTNADLSTVNSGWTYYSDAYKYENWKTTEADIPVVEFYSQWNSGASVSITQKDFKFSQTITLPAGDYRIAVNALYRNGAGDGTNPDKAWIFAGVNKQNVYAVTSSDASDLGNASGPYSSSKLKTDLGRASYAFSIGKFSNAFDFSLTEETEIELGFQGYFNTSLSWCALGPVKLYKYSLDDYLTDYDAKYAEAEALNGKPMNADVQAALTAAMVDKSTFTLTSQVTAAIQTLTTAVNNANASVGYYAAIKAVIDANATKVSTYLDSYGSEAYNTAAATALAAYNDCTATDGADEIDALNEAYVTALLATKQPANGTDMTAYITNADFDSGTTTGWTIDTPYGGNCGIQGGSRMEYWAGNASDRANASFNIYQDLTNLPAGVYTVSADMYNSLNGEGGNYTEFSSTCGVYGVSSNEEVALVTAEGTTLNTYTTDEILVFRGKMTVGTKNTVTPIAARWFVFDNVKLTYVRQLTAEEIAANIVPESISLDPTTVNMTIYGTQTLTPTILPDNANDKSITWTSSNESVATVANGVVTAVGIGSATITATANGADGVEATASVTVSDVTAAAAPSFYSTVIADGTDYYILNAATGKFLGGANSWGTQASLIEHGIPFGAAKISDGVYTLDSYTYNSTTAHFFGGTYVDAASTNLYITSLGDGKFSIATADGSAFVTAWTNSTYVTNEAVNATSSLAQWYFITKADRDKMLAAATVENPVDATYYVRQANPSRNLSAGGYNVNAWSDYQLEGDATNNVGQLYQTAGDVSQTINNIPNGTYTVAVQAFTSGTATFYANEQKVAVLANSEGIGAAATAANRFAAKAFTNTLTVTVTDRTLKIGLKSDDTDKWLVWDDVTLYMTSYTANTGVTASIDKSEIQIGQTATITAATDPSDASFNAITSYVSSDESIATVDENGVVTGVAVGNATITITANEMENFNKTINVTVTLVTPTAFALSESEVELDAETTTATLTIVPTPEGANDAAIWTSSDETVATVANGVVTAVSTGTATITATSLIDANVSATATVTVSFPESTVPATYYVNDGATRTVYTLGENLIKNGSFEYPNTFYGWKNGKGLDMGTDGFDVLTEEGNTYVKSKKGEGGANTTAVQMGWAIESGKTYTFSYKIKGNAGTSDWTATSLTNEIGQETYMIERSISVTTDWQEHKYTFTNTGNYAYLQFFARWYDAAYDDFYLAETESITEGNVDYATAAIPTANIGTSAFQYSQDAIDAANALVQGEATVEDVEDAYDAVTTLKAPTEDQVFNIVMGELTWTNNNNATMLSTLGKAVTYYAGGRSDAGGYTAQFDKEPNTNLAQAFHFTAAEGKNKYSIYQVDADGNNRYLCTGTVYKGNANQVRTTTVAASAEVYTITATATEGVYNLTNSSNINLGAQDAGLFGTTHNNNLLLVATSKPSISINTTAAGWGTTMLPFAVAELPEGVKAYTCAEVSGSTLTLVEVNALEANKPYIIEGAWSETLTGDAQGTALTYTEGLLTGVYATQAATDGTYILQNQDGKVGFYQVNTAEAQPNVPANRAYLTAPAAGVKAFYFDDATAISSVLDGIAAGSIYDLNGRKVAKMQKGGIYVVNGKKIIIK